MGGDRGWFFNLQDFKGIMASDIVRNCIFVGPVLSVIFCAFSFVDVILYIHYI